MNQQHSKMGRKSNRIEAMKSLKDLYHRFVAWWGDLRYGHPSRKLFVIGVTGTKGKSLTIELINAVLQEAGEKTAVLSSVKERIAGEERQNKSGNTMPGRGYVQKFLAAAVQAGVKYALVEVTSQGVVQHRHEHIEWDAALCINLHPEHIESHGSFDNYREAKLDFFRYIANSPKARKVFFINKEDEHADYFVKAAGDNERHFFSGTFIKANYAAAEAVGRAFGIKEETIQKALEEFKGLPGRMEAIQDKPFKVIIDYAHTPDSLEEVYKTLGIQLKINKSAGRLICVLGSAGGGRDKWKRPKMGEAAGRNCDFIIVTNEDPWDEDPMEIIEAVAEAAEKSGKPTARIVDRQEAIDKAIAEAREGDIVVITGKGSETAIRMAGGKELPWSEREAVMKALADRNELEGGR